MIICYIWKKIKSMNLESIKAHFTEAKALLEVFYSNENNLTAIAQAGQLMVDCIKNGRKVISCGNGGSMSDAMHFAEELSGRYRENRKSLPALAISDPTHMSCTANDFGYDFVFSRFIEGLGNEGDVLLAISTSGNSSNVLNAIKAAHLKGMKTIALTGKDGGKMAGLCTVEICVPHFGYADRIQEIHIKVIHALIDFIEKNTAQ